MRKTFGLIGISALLLVGCGSAEQEDQPTEAVEEPVAGELQISGAIHAKGDNALYMDEDYCIAGHPAVAGAMSGIEGTQVTVVDADESVAAVTEFETRFSEDECIWFFNAEVDGSSKFYRAQFLDMETPIESTDNAEDGVLMLDPKQPITEKAEDSSSVVDSFPGN